MIVPVRLLYGLMTHNQQHLIALFKGHLRGDLSAADQEQLDDWIAASERNRRLFESFDDEEQLRQLILQYHQEEEENAEEMILQKIKLGLGGSLTKAPVKKLHSKWSWGWVAAATMVVSGVGGYLLLNNKADKIKEQTAATEKIQPGKDGAILTLADGSTVVLDSLGNGVIASQSGSQVVLNNGALTYSQDATATSVYNHLSTPKGRQFKLTLPDGTKVWLNAASSIKYPTVFDGANRWVSVTGEVYFEVTQDHHQPFNIDVNEKAMIRVLGTQFNVNAYANEPAIKATLVDGSIQIRPGAGQDTSSFVSLKPGYQATIKQNGRETNKEVVKIEKDANIQKTIAWKNGFFNFDGMSLREVMRQIERWYDVEVEFEDHVPDEKFVGAMGRDMSLEGVLQILKENEANFRVEGRKIIVLP